ISSSRLGSLGVARIIQPLIRKSIPPSRKILLASKSARNQATWAVTQIVFAGRCARPAGSRLQWELCTPAIVVPLRLTTGHQRHMGCGQLRE
ncbi:MAG TPA: hypothetical protein VII49_09530, partial [Rhizomicrobium sp.]